MKALFALILLSSIVLLQSFYRSALKTTQIALRRSNYLQLHGRHKIRSLRMSSNEPARADLPLISLLQKVNMCVEIKDFFAPLWEAIRYEASTMSTNDLRASTLLTNAILAQPSFEEALIDFIANQLETPLFQATQFRNIFVDVIAQNRSIARAWALDLLASAVRDRSQPNTVSVLLFNKGFHALATYRIAHTLWHTGRDGLARYLQSTASRIFASDIHPACNIGPGCYISTGSGVVIGETASLGSECCIKHGVTLGGTGKESGDRHPKLGNGVFVAAGATILGNIPVGDGSVINAGSVVTKPVAPYTRVGGVPARFISNLTISSLPYAPSVSSPGVSLIERMSSSLGASLLQLGGGLEEVSESKYDYTDSL